MLHDAIEETFLSKWFHKETLISEEPLCFTKGSLWRKKSYLGYKKVRNRWFCVEPIFLFYGIAKEAFKHLYF